MTTSFKREGETSTCSPPRSACSLTSPHPTAPNVLLYIFPLAFFVEAPVTSSPITGDREGGIGRPDAWLLFQHPPDRLQPLLHPQPVLVLLR
ncbi:hypothetical protein FJTKL_10810 [Diaporthe vaccinii]|uniref:Uncharacterized protein n=1 Tax=Diaporthe vaccinii TaxID=105482 RepID=A0ABR4FBV6_9PEZI